MHTLINVKVLELFGQTTDNKPLPKMLESNIVVIIMIT